MAAYLRFYQIETPPFENDARNRGIVLDTQSLRAAFTQVKQGLDAGSARILLCGPEGVGKTSLCRALPKLLAETSRTAVILDPRRPYQEIRSVIARQLNLQGSSSSREALLAARGNLRRLVLVIDRAETLSHELLDHLDLLLQYKSDDGRQFLHCVMLANLESASCGIEVPLLWWLDNFAIQQLRFSPIPRAGLRHYVDKHLARAGWTGGELFCDEALDSIHCETDGIPRAINGLCERILIEGAARGAASISRDLVEELCGGASPETANLELSGDFSIGSFETSPPTLELTDTSPETMPAADAARIEVKREPLCEGAPDIASLLITQDSPEPLRVGAEAPLRDASPASLQLECEPRRALDEEFYRTRHSARPAASSSAHVLLEIPTRRGPGRMLAVLLLLALSAGTIDWQQSGSTELIESAEVKIADVLASRAGSGPAPEADAVEDRPERYTLPASILDRADEGGTDAPLDLALPDLAPTAVPMPTPASAPPSGFSRELLVINEYTALPEAASPAPGLPSPVQAEPAADLDPLAKIENLDDLEPAPEVLQQPHGAPPADGVPGSTTPTAP